MAVTRRTRGVQYPLVAEFVFNYNDGQAYLSSLTGASVDLNPKANVTDFGSGVQPVGLLSGITYVANTGGQTYYFEVLTLPQNAQVFGGDVQVEVPYVGPSTATLSLGDVNSGTLYASAVNLKASALGGTGYASGAHTGSTVTLTVGSGHGVVAGNLINVSGVTGAGAAAYNGTYIVDSVTATTIVYTSAAGVTDAANTAAAGSPTVTFTVGRTALTIPGEQTNQGGYASTTQIGYDAAAGADIRMTLALGAGAATQGRVRIRVMYTIDGRMTEVGTQ